MEFNHIPIMLNEVIDNLNIKPNGIYVDLTVGGAGHSTEILRRIKNGKLICVDQDEEALSVARDRLLKISDNVLFYKSNFENFKEILDYFGIDKVDGVLLDIGVSSYQIDNGQRGFSYMIDAPLDMRMDRDLKKSAFDVVNYYNSEDLEYIFYNYGEEKWTKRIVEFIVNYRKEKLIETTFGLVDIIERAIPKAVRAKGGHPAKRVFQAIRIEVNRELEVIKKVIPDIVERLNKNGRLCIITFHSLEDRIVKDSFKELARGCICPKDSLEFLKILSDEEFMEYEKEVLKNILNIEKEYLSLKLNTLMIGEYDSNNAILEIHAGAGGTDAQDWTEMLQRLYTRWINSKGFSFSILDYNSDTEGGIKSVTLKVEGKNAYGFLKGEKGVHRLVRISPYDSSNKRHTSFASVDVFPEIEEITDIEINPKDLRIDTYRSGGAGGQHVNKTDSAVRITHIPTGVTVSCQSERSQMFNRDTAMRQLIAKLLIIKQEENREKIEDIQGKYSQIAWGSQIRSYVFQPYTLVKDHRTGYETGNVESVMNGNIDEFINQYLCELIKKSR